MNYWKEEKTSNGCGTPGIVLPSSIHHGNIIGICFGEDGDTVEIMEECDAWYRRSMTADEAVAMMEEAIQWIKENATF